jgi:hypothetical protein
MDGCDDKYRRPHAAVLVRFSHIVPSRSVGDRGDVPHAESGKNLSFCFHRLQGIDLAASHP